MQNYVKLYSEFWTGETGRALKKLGPSVQVVAFYLINNPHTTMIGIYYLPFAYIVQDTGLQLNKVKTGIKHLCQLDFCCYDERQEFVWVMNMARFQVGDQLKPKDNRLMCINKLYQSLPQLNFLEKFYQKYHQRFSLGGLAQASNTSKVLGRSLEGPSKDLYSEGKLDDEIEKDQSDRIITDASQILDPQTPLASTLEGPSEILQSQKQKQYQKQYQKQKQKQKQYQKIRYVAPLTLAQPLSVDNSTGLSTISHSQPERSSKAQNLTADIEEIFQHWQAIMHHPQAKLDAKRKRVITQALQSGYSISQLCQAISGCAQTPFNMGENDRGERYDSLALILRDSDHIDRFIHNDQSPPQPKSINPVLENNARVMKELLDREQNNVINEEHQRNIDRARARLEER